MPACFTELVHQNIRFQTKEVILIGIIFQNCYSKAAIRFVPFFLGKGTGREHSIYFKFCTIYTEKMYIRYNIHILFKML